MEVLDLKLFDLDGTLIDSNGVWIDIDVAFLEKRGLSYTPEYSAGVAHAIFPTAAKFTREYFQLPDSPEDIMAEWLEMARQAYAGEIPLKPFARAYLEQEFQKGEPLAIVTACVPDLCRAVLAHHGLTGLFREIVFAHDIGMEKRDPRFFDGVIARLGVTASDCTLYEDAPDNCAAAKAAGIRVVGVHDDFFAGSEGEIRAVSDRYIMNFGELMDEPLS